MKGQQKTILALGLIMAFVATVLFFPGLMRAGDLEPTAAPGPTMKTLDQIPPTWSQILPDSERFELVLNNQGVLDKETGLVWQRIVSVNPSTFDWAVFRCYNYFTLDRKGWRLPTVEELASLLDESLGAPSNLPDGHPFSNVRTDQSDWYWTQTTSVQDTSRAWKIRFWNGEVNWDSLKTESHYYWCVRGGHGHDAY